LEYHWLNWPNVEDGKHRYCIPEKGIIFTDEYIDNQYSEHNGFFEITAKTLRPEEKTAMLERVEQWEKNGRKWRYRDKAFQYEDYKQVAFPEISALSHQEMLDNLNFVIWGNRPKEENPPLYKLKDARKTFFGFGGDDVGDALKRHFNLAEQVSIRFGTKYDEKINESPPPPPSPPPPKPLEIETRERQAYIGLIVESEVDEETGEVTYYDTTQPLYFDYDGQGLEHTLAIGRTGSGKSVTGIDIVEGALENDIPVLVIDITNQWTGFFKECDDPNLISLYPKFGIKKLNGVRGKIYTPSLDIGLPLRTNLLRCPDLPKEKEKKEALLSFKSRTVSSIISRFCGISSKDDSLEIREKILEFWDQGEHLDYELIISQKFSKDRITTQLKTLSEVSFLFDKKAPEIEFSEFVKPKEINVIAMREIENLNVKMFVSFYILQKLYDYFTSDSPNRMKFLLVVDEAHDFSGEAVEMLDLIARTMRKNGVGCLFISQRLKDMNPRIRSNSGTRIFMNLRDELDIDEARKELGELADLFPNVKKGSGFINYSEYDEPLYVRYRPCRVRYTRMENDEIKELMQQYKS